MKKKVGILTNEVINLLNLDKSLLDDLTIYLNPNRKKHMIKHQNEFKDFEKVYDSISAIIQNADYVGKHPNGKSVEYIKKIDGNVLVAVRIDKKLTVRTMYTITDTKLKNYIKSGRTKRCHL